MKRIVTYGLVAALLVAGGTAGYPPGPVGAGIGSGDPSLQLSSSTLPADRVSTLTVSGDDYLMPPHEPGNSVFGGIYVFFGWVAGGNWGPSGRTSDSNNGHFGTTYHYPGDGGTPSTRGDGGAGTMQLVAFTEGGESGTGTDYHMDRNGDWTTTLSIYGSTYRTVNPQTGEEQVVDCQQVQCGVLTMGGHGRASATNEVFTPLNFSGNPQAEPIPPGTSGDGAGAGGGPGGGNGEAGGPGGAGSDGGFEASAGGGDGDDSGGDTGAADDGADDSEADDAAPDDVQLDDVASHADGDTVAIGVTSSGEGIDLPVVPLVAAGAAVLAVLVTFLSLRRRRRKARTDEAGEADDFDDADDLDDADDFDEKVDDDSARSSST